VNLLNNQYNYSIDSNSVAFFLHNVLIWQSSGGKLRVVTRSDFDGLVCVALLQELDMVSDILYVHPKDIQDGKVSITPYDILANVPYVPECALWFDHHSSEEERLKFEGKFEGLSIKAASTAQVIYEFYGGEGEPRMAKFKTLIESVNKADSAKYTRDDIIHPKGWMMMAFLTDPRTGLGYHRGFKISNFQLMKKLPDYFQTMSIQEILGLSDVKERIEVYKASVHKYIKFITMHSTTVGNAAIIDVRGVKEKPIGNRFLEYAIFPEQNISIRLSDGKNQANVMISMGKSILNRTSALDVGSLMLGYHGGGHKAVGTCQVDNWEVPTVLENLLKHINKS
jgi:hypothetical protein